VTAIGKKDFRKSRLSAEPNRLEGGKRTFRETTPA
jgi:hypothetical protein